MTGLQRADWESNGVRVSKSSSVVAQRVLSVVRQSRWPAAQLRLRPGRRHVGTQSLRPCRPYVFRLRRPAVSTLSRRRQEVLLPAQRVPHHQCQYIPKTLYFRSRLAAYWPAPIHAVAHCWPMLQGDHLSGKPGKPGNVREFGTCQGNVREKILSWKSVPKLFITRWILAFPSKTVHSYIYT